MGKGVLNIKNEKDSYFFAYSILASIHPVGYKENANFPSKYKPYMSELNVKGLMFPLIPKDVNKFERQNPTIVSTSYSGPKIKHFLSKWQNIATDLIMSIYFFFMTIKQLDLITLLYVTCLDSMLDALKLALKHTYVLIVFTVFQIQICWRTTFQSAPFILYRNNLSGTEG